MAEKHPYASPGTVIAAINQFRKSFPAKVNADTLKKLGIAPNNESYVINTLRFLGVINAEGNKTDSAVAVFNQHDTHSFQKAFEGMLKAAYHELLDLHGDAAWELSADGLISFFRSTDQTSDAVGRRQASTFQALAGIAGHGEPQSVQKSPPKPKDLKPKLDREGSSKKALVPAKGDSAGFNENMLMRDVGLTVRVEVNLPPAADQNTYDRIFRSIRDNLLSAKP